MNEIEIRAAQLGEVNFPKRLIEMVVVPYESISEVAEYHGRQIREVFARGAFDGIERRANRVRVNRDHDLRRVVGRATSFRSSADALVAEVRIARTELGDETLALADDEILDASAGFAVPKGGERWEGRSMRRIVKAFLAHIALTPDPAYDEARVLAVRSAVRVETPTPNRDRLEIERLRAEYEALDRRWRVQP